MPISPETPIILVTDEADDGVVTTFGQFVEDNEFGEEWLTEITVAMETAGRYDGGGGATPDWSIRLASLGASRIEAFLDAEGCWWAMPYKFADGATAEGFLSRLRVENPGREFRVAA